MRALLSLGLIAAALVWGQAPEMILINGKIVTADPQFSIRAALAVRDGKIASVGTSAEIRKTADPNTRVIDLQGRTVIPGLIDSHMHAIRAAHFSRPKPTGQACRRLRKRCSGFDLRRRARTLETGSSWAAVGNLSSSGKSGFRRRQS